LDADATQVFAQLAYGRVGEVHTGAPRGFQHSAVRGGRPEQVEPECPAEAGRNIAYVRIERTDEVFPHREQRPALPVAQRPADLGEELDALGLVGDRR
jgi:hypothetical protein